MDLTLPHTGLYKRDFVLYPLYECNPELILPNGQKLKSKIKKLVPND
jgi:2-amino-4-hydroxy-6-hydroxymethyldihydropteridine diphosphokinase